MKFVDLVNIVIATIIICTIVYTIPYFIQAYNYMMWGIWMQSHCIQAVDVVICK